MWCCMPDIISTFRFGADVDAEVWSRQELERTARPSRSGDLLKETMGWVHHGDDAVYLCSGAVLKLPTSKCRSQTRRSFAVLRFRLNQVQCICVENEVLRTGVHRVGRTRNVRCF